ncbi:hypothetical protein B0H11DRAFT_1820659 [Mycena galericulata]|nr:hypothetical protein B0H11DRAFT_1820659 [Mycena galericulata]
MSTLPTDSQPPTVASQLASINQAIAWHYTQIAILKAQANALNPISTLPNELISKIFGIYAFIDGPPYDLKWTKVMLVCRRWHAIALSEQSLWGFIEVSYSRNIRRVQMQLDRSGAAPVTVKIMSLDSGLYAVILLEHAERLYQLHLCGPAPRVLDFMNSLPDHRFPLLRSVKLDPSYKWEEVPEDVPTAWPDVLFDGRAPCLTALDLSHIRINWSLLQGFDRLLLTLTNDATGEPATFAKVLSALRASPNLTYLKLGRVIGSHFPLQSYPVVSLPRLEFIWIQDDVALCNELLRHIAMPSTARISVYGFGIRAGADIAPLLVPVRKHVRARDAPTLRCLQLDATDSRGRTNFMLSTFTATTAPNALEYDKATFLVNTHPATEHALRTIMTKVLKALPCSGITHLDARAAPHLTVASWKAALALLPALEMMYTFVNSAATRLFTALVELTENPRGGVFPPLRHVHLYAYVWRRSDDGGADADVVAPVLAALRRLLAVRHRRGTPLPVLEIDEQVDSLGMREEEWEALFEQVGKFIRNGEDYDPPARRREIEEFRRKWSAGHLGDSDSE